MVTGNLKTHRWVQMLKKLMPSLQIMVDFHACTWPKAMDAASPSLATHFDQMNEEPVADVVSACTNHAASSCNWPPVITFSHFLPLQVYSRLQLICAKQMLTFRLCSSWLLSIHPSSFYRLTARSKAAAL